MFSWKNAGFVIWIVLFLLLLLNTAFAEINVTLDYPQDDSVFNLTNNITFNCSVAGDKYLKNVSLYHNITGGFVLNQTEYVGEYGVDSNTEFLCHYNDDLECYGGSIFLNSSASYESVKFYNGVLVNSDDTLAYDLNSAMDREQGTIEVWIKKTSELNINSGQHFVFEAGATSPDEYNEFQIYIVSGYLYFSILDSAETEHYVRRDASFLQDDNVYHIVGVWDLDSGVSGNSRLELYVNASNVSNEYSGTYSNLTLTGNPDLISVGTWKTAYEQFDSVIDELRILDVVKTPSEINQSYQRELSTTYNASFSLYNITDGTHGWNCLAYNNESQSSWNNTNFSLIIDTVTSPVVNYINMTPSSADDIDPNMNISITANVTDVSGVDTVIFQWKETGDWNNGTMDYGDGTYVNATIAVDVTGGLYYYRIWSNDTVGASGYSTTQNITADFDYTWIVSPSGIGNSSGFVSTMKNIANITINNTGDDTLEFSITDNWPFNVTYDGSDNPLYIVSAKDVATIAVNATFEGQSNERDISITITASHGTQTPSPLTRTVNGTLTSYTGGPYLVAEIITIPTSVNHSTTVNLSATVKNIGNETAVDVLFNWTLPSGWSNTTGGLNIFIGNMSSQVINVSVLGVTISSSTQVGVVTVCVNSSDAGNTTGYDCGNVLVGCSNVDGVCGAGCSHLTDSDCSSGNGGNGGGSSGGVGGVRAIVPEISIDAPSRLDTVRGETVGFKIRVTNVEQGTTVENVQIDIAGHPQTYIGIVPESFDELEYNETVDFVVELTIPDYMQYGTYDLIITAAGEVGDDSIEASADIALLVHSVTENETVVLFRRAEDSVQEMVDAEFNVDYVNRLIDQSRVAMDGGDYNTVKRLSEEIINIKDTAFVVYDLMQRISQTTEEAKVYGIEAPESQKMYALALAAFERGDYNRAEERANSAILAQNIEIGDRLLFAKFLHDYWWLMIIIAVSAVFAIIISRGKIMALMIKKRLEFLKKEEVAILGLIKNLQIRCFERKEIGRVEYNESMADYEKRLADNKKERSRLLSRHVKVLRFRAISEDLEKRRGHIIDLIKETQKKYFELGAISKKSYNETVRELRNELADIDNTKGDRKKKRVHLLFLFLVVPLLVGNAFALDVGERDLAMNALNVAESNVKEMQDLGFAIGRVNDTLKEARLLFSEGNYLGAESLAKYVGTLKEAAIIVDALIDEAEVKIYESETRGVDVSSVKEFFVSGIDAFERERYEEAEEFLALSINRVDEIESELALQKILEGSGQENIILFFQEYWYVIAASVAGFFIIVFVIRRVTEARRVMEKIKSLEGERMAVENKIRRVQKKYFERGEIPKSEYKIALGKYRKRLGSIKKDISILTKRTN